MTHLTTQQIISAQAEGITGTAGQSGTAGAAGASGVGVASDSVASHTGGLFLETPGTLHLTVSGSAGEASLVIGSLDGQTVLASNGVLSIEAADGQAAVLLDLDGDPDHAAVDPPQSGSHESLALEHEARALEFEARFMEKFHEQCGWSLIC
jgi:hypothetical protein